MAQPCDSYPTLFARGSIFDRFPFLLPNLVCAVILALGVLIGILFLEETHEKKRYRRDIGLEIGDWITRRCRIQESCHFSDKAGDAHLVEAESLLFEDDEPPGYRTTDGTPRQQVSRSQSPSNAALGPTRRDKEGLQLKSNGARKVFTRQVILNIVGYGILA